MGFNSGCERYFEIEVYDKAVYEARYLAHGFTDHIWTDNINEACDFIKKEIGIYEKSND